MVCQKSLYEIIKDSANLHPNYTAIYYENKKINYKKLLNEIDELALFLHNLNVKAKDVVTVVLPNMPISVMALYAINKLGAICYEVHPKTNCLKMEQYIEKTNSKIILALDIFSKEYLPLSVKKGITIVTFNPFKGFNLFKSIFCEINSPNKNIIKYKRKKSKIILESYKWNPLETSVLLNSGGTSGNDKIIELSNLAINKLASNGTDILGITEGKGVFMLAVLPMFHGFGLCMGVHSPLMYGACVSLMLKFHTKSTIKLIKSGHLTIMIGVPAMFKALLHNPKFYIPELKNITTAYVGGDFVPQDLVDKFNQTMTQYNSRARLFEGYGLTETVTVCSVNTDKNHKIGSVGKAVRYAQIRIVDSKTHQFLPNNQDGEIVVSGDILMNGYYKNEELTNQTFIIKDETKWVLTGDYGHLDDDGYLYFKQRLKRIVKVSGVIVCPSDIENVVSKIDEVYDVFATSITHERRGHMIVLFVVKNRSNIIDDNKLNQIINQTIKDKVSVYAQPYKIVYLDSLPKTEIGKTDALKIESTYLVNIKGEC